MSKKSIDRLNISKEAHDIVERIDQNNYLGLGVSSTSRSQLFIFAMAIGFETLPTKLRSIHQGGFILDSSLDSKTKSIIYGLFIHHLNDTSQIDKISDKESVYKLAQEYANTGFEVIGHYMDNHTEDDLLWKIIANLDDLYQDIVE